MSASFYAAASQLPPFLSASLLRVGAAGAAAVTEIRLRSGRPLQLTLPDGAAFLLPDGTLCAQARPEALTVSHRQLNECFMALCQFSVHSIEQELAQGFFTIDGGHRVGVAGTAVCGPEGGIQRLKNPTSLCIRIARAPRAALPPALAELLRPPCPGLILAGAPGSGKTTVLRGCGELLSQLGRRVVAVDERRELWPAAADGFAHRPPDRCDVLSGCPKHLGILMALRSLSPQVLLCDEVGSAADTAALAAGANAGVGLIVTIHARAPAELLRRPQARLLLATGAFAQIAFLCGAQQPGRLREVVDVDSLL